METLSAQISKAAGELQTSLSEDSQYPNIMPLRILRHTCSNRLFKYQNKYELLLAFILCCFIDDMFTNFGVDTPYDKELHVTRLSICTKITDTLKVIGPALVEDKRDIVCNSLSDLVEDYFNKIDSLNKSKSF